MKRLDSHLGVTVGALLAVVVRPRLWLTAIGVAGRLAAPGWWRRWPPRPEPTEPYRRFRSETMFGGDGSRALGPAELVGYLVWCQQQRRGDVGTRASPGGRNRVA